jgi:hypothetical protein
LAPGQGVRVRFFLCAHSGCGDIRAKNFGAKFCELVAGILQPVAFDYELAARLLV